MDLKDIEKSEDCKEDGIKKKKVGFLLGTGIFIAPWLFSWFTLRKGHSKVAKGISFTWLFIIAIAAFNQNGAKHTSRSVAAVGDTPKVKQQITFIKESCKNLSRDFGASSKRSDIQKKELWKKYKGKAFKWALEVTEVSEATFGSGYQVQYKCKRSNAFISDLIVSYPNSAKSMVMKLQKGSSYMIKGRLEDYNALIGLSAESL